MNKLFLIVILLFITLIKSAAVKPSIGEVKKLTEGESEVLRTTFEAVKNVFQEAKAGGGLDATFEAVKQIFENELSGGVEESNKLGRFSEHIKETLPGGKSGATVEKILSLVSIAENSDTKWWDNYNYIEDINDGRGYTISIVGFCTGTGDFIQVLDEIAKVNKTHPLSCFIPLVRDKKGGDVSGLSKLPTVIKSIGNDQVYLDAVWKVIRKLYWDPAVDFCKKNNLKSALALYIVYDTLLNFGTLEMFESLNDKDEKAFLKEFLDVKQSTIEKDDSLGESKDNRVDMQKKLLQSGDMEFENPLHVSCYGDSFIV